MVERKRGHIVALSSASGITALPEAITYSSTKFGVRGFMESLAMQLLHRGESDFIKTTCIFPYFIRTSQAPVESVMQGCRHKILYDVSHSARKMVEGILRNEEIITIPRVHYFFLYLT